MRVEHDTTQRGAGILVISEDDAADDVVAFRRESDAFPWLVFDPIEGAILIGDGDNEPEQVLPTP